MESLFFLLFLCVITCLVMGMIPTLTKHLHDMEDEHLKKIQLSNYSAYEFGQMLLEKKHLSHISIQAVNSDDTWYDVRTKSLRVSDNVLHHYSYLSLAIITQSLMQAALFARVKWALFTQRMIAFSIPFFLLASVIFTGLYFINHQSEPVFLCLYLALSMFVGYYGYMLLQTIITWYQTWKSLKKHDVPLTTDGLELVRAYIKGRVTLHAAHFFSTVCWFTLVQQIILFAQ